MNSPVPEDGVFKRVERVFLPRWRSWLNSLTALPTVTPLQVAYYRSGKFRQKIAELLDQNDAAFAHLIRTGHWLIDFPGPKFLEMTDAISLNYERIREGTRRSSLGFRSRIFSLEARRLRRYECEVVDHFEYSFLVSDVDKKYLFPDDSVRQRRVLVCSNGVDLSSLPFNFSNSGHDVVFIGNMTTVQNLDAALFLAQDILPIVRKRLPNVRLRVIGRIAPPERARLTGYPGVEVIGEVPSVAAAASGAVVGACPMRLGAGVQNKVLEYMALGLPTVTTSIGLEGISARPGVELSVADDAATFGAEIVRLIERRDEAMAAATAAREYVERHHAWDTMLGPMVAAIEERIG